MFPEILYKLFSGNPRQGPGSNECTRRAYQMCKDLPPQSEILDVGCGSGTQTLELAMICDGHITALDHYQPVLDTLNKRIQEEVLTGKITTVNGSMFELPFAAGTFDLIWAEGSIFIIGFEKGLREWKPLVKKGGYIVVSDLTLIRHDAPQELLDYLASVDPTIQYAEGNWEIMRQAGYRKIGDFILPASGWRDDFYIPLQQRIHMFRDKYAGNAEAQGFLDSMQKEIDIFNQYNAYYGYVFYIMQPV